MTTQTDKVEFFHLSELPTNITANFTTANSCVSRHFNNKFGYLLHVNIVKAGSSHDSSQLLSKYMTHEARK